MAKKTERKTWVIRAGIKGSANDLFLEESVIALEDAGLQDLSSLQSTRNEFYDKYKNVHPAESRKASIGIGGKFFRFAVEVLVQDTVLYSCLIDKCVYVGKVTGEYEFVELDTFPHQRTVNWKYVISKADFSIKAQRELGAARTLFRFKRHLGELEKLVASGSSRKFKKSKAPNKRKSVKK